MLNFHSLERPCDGCVAPYGFHHQMPLGDDTGRFRVSRSIHTSHIILSPYFDLFISAANLYLLFRHEVVFEILWKFHCLVDHYCGNGKSDITFSEYKGGGERVKCDCDIDDCLHYLPIWKCNYN